MLAKPVHTEIKSVLFQWNDKAPEVPPPRMAIGRISNIWSVQMSK